MYILDSNIVSHAMKGHEGVAKRLQKEGRLGVFVTPHTVEEIWYGIHWVGSKKLAERARTILDPIRVLDYTPEMAELCAKLRVKSSRGLTGEKGSGITMNYADPQIAASAMVLGYTLVTNNTKDFKHLEVDGLKLEDWV